MTTLYKHSIQILATLIFPMVIGIILIAPQIVPFIFGDEFLPTIRVLQVLIIALIFVFLNEPNIRMMLVHDRQRWISIFLIISVTINISLNLILVPSRGAVGAAAARGSSAFILYLLTLLYVRRTITTVNLIHLLVKPAIAASVMALVLIPIRDWPWLLLIAVGSVVYVVVLKLIGGFPPIQWNELFLRLRTQSDDGVPADIVRNIQLRSQTR